MVGHNCTYLLYVARTCTTTSSLSRARIAAGSYTSILYDTVSPRHSNQGYSIKNSGKFDVGLTTPQPIFLR
jgi:hypothetical protein